MGLRQKLAMLIAGKPKTGHDALINVRKRSPKWPAFRKQWLLRHPMCAACGNRKASAVQVHHIRPLHHGGDELSEDNLITLCEDGPANTNCHCLLGHCGDWRHMNPRVAIDALQMSVMLANRVEG